MKSTAAQEKHEKTADFVEKLTEIVYFVEVKLAVPFAILPRVIISYFNYFTMYAGDDTFQLPYAAW